MTEPVSPKNHQLLFHVIALRQPDGSQLGLIDSKEILAAAHDPHKHWVGAKHIVITREGATLETCVRNVSPDYQPGSIPTTATIEEAVAFAAS